MIDISPLKVHREATYHDLTSTPRIAVATPRENILYLIVKSFIEYSYFTGEGRMA
jgi:hypothetical protein